MKRLAFVALIVAICLPGLLGANAWLENSDVDRYVEMARGEVGEIITRSWRVFAAILVVGAGVSEKTAILLLVAAAQDRRAIAFVGLFAVAQFAARGTSTFGWPDKEMLRGNLTPGRWFRVALSFGVPALLAVRARNVPRPLLAGLAGVAGMLVYGTLAARVDGRFAWLASAFTVPMALIPRRK